MIALLICLCLAVMGAFIYFESKKNYLVAVILKGTASLLFVCLGFWCSRNTGNTEFAKMVRAGLLFGFVADVLLNLRFLFENKGKIVFLAGILVFLIGHIFYICALVPTMKSVIPSVIIGVVLTVAILKWLFTQIEAELPFKIFGVFYIGIIVIMNCFAYANLIINPDTRNTLFTIGAFLFLASDIILILNTFGKETKQSLRIANLVLYYCGQILIACSLMFPILYIE